MSLLSSLFICLCLCCPYLINHIFKDETPSIPINVWMSGLFWLHKSLLLHLWLLYTAQMLTMVENVAFTVDVLISSLLLAAFHHSTLRRKGDLSSFVAFGSYRWFFSAVPL